MGKNINNIKIIKKFFVIITIILLLQMVIPIFPVLGKEKFDYSSLGLSDSAAFVDAFYKDKSIAQGLSEDDIDKIQSDLYDLCLFYQNEASYAVTEDQRNGYIRFILSCRSNYYRIGVF